MSEQEDEDMQVFWDEGPGGIPKTDPRWVWRRRGNIIRAVESGTKTIPGALALVESAPAPTPPDIMAVLEELRSRDAGLEARVTALALRLEEAVAAIKALRADNAGLEVRVAALEDETERLDEHD